MNTEYWYEANKNYLMSRILRAYEEIGKNMDDLISVQENLPVREIRKSGKDAEYSLEGLSNLEALVNSCGLSAFEEKILLICAGVQVNNAYGKLISKWQEDEHGMHPSFSLLLKGFKDAHWNAIAPASPLNKWYILRQDNQNIVINSTLKIDDSVLHFLLGINQLSKDLEGIVTPVSLPVLLSPYQAGIIKREAELIASDEKRQYLPMVRLQRANKLTAAMALCQQFGLDLFRLNMTALSNPGEDLAKHTGIWNRDAATKHYALYIDLENATSESSSVNYTISNFIDGIHSLVFLDGQLHIPVNRDQVNFSLPNPTRGEQIDYLGECTGLTKGKKKDSLAEIVEFFDPDYLTINKVANKVNMVQKFEKAEGKSAKEDWTENLWAGFRDSTRPVLDDLAYRIDVKATWDDIVLLPAHLATLKEIAEQVRHRHQVYKEWKFAEKLNRGLGISALFTGASGTGKTMAAEVIANELKLDLYRVDLSQVVNKYIGETEKNIKKVFDAAESSGVILLFDEADALFGKRSEVKDSHDRYSNIQLGYLLQRMEEYTGLAILTTNMKQSIDKAFERRIRFTIHFQPPDVILRKHIWEKVFPKPSKINGIDFDKLSRVNLPGGNIRNIALNAAFSAASEKSAISMKQILHATKMEFDKMEKALSRNEINDWV